MQNEKLKLMMILEVSPEGETLMKEKESDPSIDRPL